MIESEKYITAEGAALYSLGLQNVMYTGMKLVQKRWEQPSGAM